MDPIRIDIYHHHAGPLDEILRLLRHLTHMEASTMADLSEITAAVANATSVEESAVTLIKALADEVRNAPGDPVALAALADQLNAGAADLAAAITANPADVPPAPAPAPEPPAPEPTTPA